MSNEYACINGTIVITINTRVVVLILFKSKFVNNMSNQVKAINLKIKRKWDSIHFIEIRDNNPHNINMLGDKKYLERWISRDLNILKT